MGGLRGRAAAAAVAISVIFGNGMAQAAESDCWSAQAISAARVRDLQSMLMVAGLRCRGSGNEVLVHYNRFVNANRSAIVAMNATLKTHFDRAYGPVEGQRSYDRFTTALANAYGAGGGGSNECGTMARLAMDAAAAGSSARLVAIAEAQGLDPHLPVRRCTTTIAAK